MEQRPPQDMLTVILKTASGVAILLALLFCGIFGYIAYTKSKFRRLKDTHDLRQRIEGYAGDYLEKRPHAALAIGVIQRGRTETFFYGKLSETNQAAPNRDTLFELGTVTQLLTALTAQKLVSDGTLNWSTSVRDILPPELELAPVFSQITLEQLATHRSGLPQVPSNLRAESIDLSNPFKEYGTSELYRYLAELEKAGPPGRSMDMSKLGYGLLGHLLERATGAPYENLVRQQILAPLQMTNTVITIGSRTNVAIGRDSDGKVTAAWDSGAFAGAVGFRSALGDLLKLVAVNITPDGSPLEAVLRECQQEHGSSFAGNVGYGWQLTSTLQGELDFVWLNGGTGGFVSFIGFDRNHQNGVVMLSSSGDAMTGDFYLDTLAMEILKLAAKISLD